MTSVAEDVQLVWDSEDNDSYDEEFGYDDDELDISTDAAVIAKKVPSPANHLMDQLLRDERATEQWRQIRKIALDLLDGLDADRQPDQNQPCLILPESWDGVSDKIERLPLASTLFESAFMSERPSILVQLQDLGILLPTATVSDVKLTPIDWDNYLTVGPVDEENPDILYVPATWQSMYELRQTCVDISNLIADENAATIGNTIIFNEEIDAIATAFLSNVVSYEAGLARYQTWLNTCETPAWEVIKKRRDVAAQIRAEKRWR